MARSITFGPGTPNEMYGKFFVIPQMPGDREFLSAVDHRTKAEIAQRYSILVDYDWQCNTIANCLMEVIIEQLAMLLKTEDKSGIGIEFFDLIKAIVSIKRNGKAEKEGNINIFFEPGEKVDKLIADGPQEWPVDHPIAPFEHFVTDDPVENEFIRNLDYHTTYVLSTKHSIMFPDHLKWPVVAIGYTFLENIFIELLYRLANMPEPEDEYTEQMVSVNFNDLIEFHAELKNGGASIRMTPGMNAKILIKCDEITEHTLGDDGRDIDLG